MCNHPTLNLELTTPNDGWYRCADCREKFSTRLEPFRITVRERVSAQPCVHWWWREDHVSGSMRMECGICGAEMVRSSKKQQGD